MTASVMDDGNMLTHGRDDFASPHATRPAWHILVAALVMGVTGDVLLREGMWRLGLTLWTTLLAIMPSRGSA